MKRRWSRIKMGWSLTSAISQMRPRDGEWIVAKDNKGCIEIVRFKRDIHDRFYPTPNKISEETISHWRPLRNLLSSYNRV